MYQALYRKYRPRTFDEVVGQRSITQTLKTQVASGRLSHAYLFTGTRGTGKTSCAKILARAVNCEHPVDGNPCNHCAACRSIEDGACMDVLEIDAASNRGIDNVRSLRDDAIYSPAEVKRRIYIIDEVHMLTMESFNALLKIIEEPPEHLIFILATTELHKVPATILSRCQRFSFRRLQQEDIAARINYVAYQEGVDLEPEAARVLARLADGALRDGVSLLDQCASSANGPVTAQFVYDCLGLSGERMTAEMLVAIANHDTSAALGLFARLYEDGKDMGAMLDELCAVARDLLILKTAPKSGLSMISGLCTGREASALAEKFSQGELLRMVTLLQETMFGISKTANLRIDAELCLMKLCNPSLQTDGESLNARLTKLEEKIASGNLTVKAAPRQAEPDVWEDEMPPFPDDADAPMTEEMPMPMQNTGSSDLPIGFWPDLVKALGPEIPLNAKGFLGNDTVTPVLRENTLNLVVSTDFVKKMISAPELLQAIGQKASVLLKRPVRAEVTVKGQQIIGGRDKLEDMISAGSRLGDRMTVR